MNYRCHECGNLFESSHTNYKFAKGFHPEDNPTHSVDVAREFDHCESCDSLRTHDPVAARTRDLAQSSGAMHSPALAALNQQIESLKAQVEQAKQEHATSIDLAAQVKELSATLATLKPQAPTPSV